MPQPYIICPTNGSDPADEWVRLGVDAQSAGKLDDAERYYRHALRLDPRSALATQNLAVVFAQKGLVNEALLTVERAAMFDGAHSVIHCNRAFMNLEADRLDEALAAARHALKVSPLKSAIATDPAQQQSYVSSRLALAIIAATAGLPGEAVPLYNEILDVEPAHPVAAPNACFVRTLTSSTPADLLAQRKRWYEAHKFTGPLKPHDNDRNPNRVLRVGYVGGDFKMHSAAMIFGAVVLHHDLAAVETYLYSTLPVDPVQDQRTRQFQAAVGDRWRDISTMNDADAETMIRRDRIDILVDLAGHTNGGRLAVFTRKPAPVQVTAWGFAHGTGLPEIDVFLADPIAVPESERGDYAEKVINLPCIVSYDPPTEYGHLKGKSALPFHQNDVITFGSYARFEKLSDECLRTFAEILRRVPGSHLEFKDHAFRRPYSIRRVQAAMQGIEPERLLFSISTSHADHLLAYQQADLCLDPWPHGGGVVTLEQLWMSCPLVTLRGTQPSGRTAASVLTAMGRPDWIAESPEEYIELAVKLANDIPLLGRVRKTLRDELLNSPVVKGYREALEKVYQQLWKDWCQR